MHTDRIEYGKLAHLPGRRLPEGYARDVETVHDAKTEHLMFHVAEHFTQGTPESTYSDGKHESKCDRSRRSPKTGCWWSKLIWNDLREAFRDARLRMITRTDLRADAGKGRLCTFFNIQVTHTVARRQLRAIHKSGKGICAAVQSGKAGLWRKTSMWKGTRNPRSNVEEKNHYSRHPSRKTRSFIGWTEALRKEDEVCAETTGETLREKLGNKSGETSLEQLSLSPVKERNPKKQYTLTESRTEAHPTRRCPLIAGLGLGNAFASQVTSKHSTAQGGMTNQRAELEHVQQSSWHSTANLW